MLSPFARIARPGLAVSLVLHALVLASATYLLKATALEHVVQPVVLVELISLPAPATSPVSSPQQEEPAAEIVPPAPDVQTPGPPAEPEMVVATKMLATSALAEPRNREASEMLEQLGDETRREQLCDIEAIEQIDVHHPELVPEGVVAYAHADPVLEDNLLIADGAAVQVGDRWLALRFRCELTSDLTAVTAFEFAVGDEIPKSEWDSHGLSIGDPD
ncbi:MAG: DUF930 domain-containing protein [Pelagibacterium sp.]|uniref:DUF930 domain-containing protein n=1 Tax=Pelagibacterium sp. TaxID=1967288 RepID=UPI0032EF599E